MRYQHNRLRQCHCKVVLCKRFVPEVKGILKQEEVTGFMAPQELLLRTANTTREEKKT